MNDESLIEAIKNSGYYEFKDVNFDDLPSDKRTIAILVTELLAFRPDLRCDENTDVVFIIQRTFENGTVGCSFPKKSLGELLKTSPYDDSVICSYSLTDDKVLKKIYRGTGTNWELI